MEKHKISWEIRRARFEKGKVTTVEKWKVLRMKPQDAEKPEKIVQIKFFVNRKHKVEMIYVIERNGRKQVWEAGPKWDFAEIAEERLDKVLEQFALENPTAFRSLYNVLQKSKQERLWKCIQEKRLEIMKLFSFS